MMKTLPVLLKKNLLLALMLIIPGIAMGKGIIIGQPVNVTECEGTATVVFRVKTAISLYGYTYQWYVAPPRSKIFVTVEEAFKGLVDGSKSTLTLEFSKVSGLGLLTTKLSGTQFKCTVKENKTGLSETSNIAYLYVNSAPSITKNPVSAEKYTGESVSFSITASGSTPRTYQWQFSDGGSYANIIGATSSTYTISSISVSDAGTYRCRVSNTCGTRYSIGATLTVYESFYEAWVEQSSGTSDDIKKVCFTSTTNGWALVNDADKLLHTTNGGENWVTASTGLGYYWRALNFVNASLGFVAGQDYIMRTENGGTSWGSYRYRDSVSLGTYSYINDFHFYDANTGWAIGSDGLILKTTDGGDNWILQNYDANPTLYLDVELYGVYFTDALNGWVVGDNGVIFRTSNGGSDWTAQTNVNTNTLYDVTFTDVNNGFAVGGTRNIIYTSNGGTNWDQVTPASLPYFYPYSVHFEGSLDGWIAGHKWVSSVSVPVIIRTNDGGLNWHEQHIEGGDALKHIHFVDNENGWAVGSTGTILRTGTGGCFLPTVNLYGDAALCAEGSYTMYADTFAKNLNCSYLWSTGDTLGYLTVYETDEYSVTVTSLCGETATDSKEIEFYPLPPANAGPDTFMCFGDTIQLNASGGVIYSWSPAGTLTDPEIQNPGAFPSYTTKYYVTVTDTNGCEQVDDVNVTVYPIPTSSFTAPAFVCGTADATINYSGSASMAANFMWDFDGGTDVPSGSTHMVSWPEIGVKTVSLVVEENTCISDTTWHAISVNPVPISDFSLADAVCGSDAVDITYSGVDSVDADYDWSFNGGTVVSGSEEGPYQVSWAAGGTKTVSLQVTQDGCESPLTQKQIVVSYPYEGQEICIVTLDSASRRNAIIWEKGDHPGVEFYRIYRETTDQGVYEPIATLPAENLSYYVDMTHETGSAQKYKISVIDTCGNESDKSLYHKTMNLTTNTGPSTINLIWEEYFVEPAAFGFKSYIIYRGTSPDQMDSIKSLPSDRKTWVDEDPPTDTTVYYQVAGVVWNPCSPTGIFKAGTGPYTHSLSNLDDNKLKTSVNTLQGNANLLRVFPNPFRDQVRVEYTLQQASDVRVEIFNILGVRVLEIEDSRQMPGEYHYDVRAQDLDGSSVYYLRFSVDDRTSVQKLIPAR